MKLLLKIMYDGKNFCGFQAQPDRRTVQGVLTEKLSELFGMNTAVTGCSRTDSGVHALGFCVTAEPAVEKNDDWLKIPVSKVHRAANNILPDDISVAGAFITDDSFHPRYSVVEKKYIYRISDSIIPSPFLKDRVFEYGRHLVDDKIRRMKEAASHFEGRKNFTSFMASGSKITDAVRTVYSADVYRDSDGCVCFEVSADGFLYNMVRIMAGTLIDVAEGRCEPSDIDRITEGGDRSLAGTTLPAGGLYLAEVKYPFPIEWQAD